MQIYRVGFEICDLGPICGPILLEICRFGGRPSGAKSWIPGECRHNLQKTPKPNRARPVQSCDEIAGLRSPRPVPLIVREVLTALVVAQESIPHTKSMSQIAPRYGVRLRDQVVRVEYGGARATAIEAGSSLPRCTGTSPCRQEASAPFFFYRRASIQKWPADRRRRRAPLFRVPLSMTVMPGMPNWSASAALLFQNAY